MAGLRDATEFDVYKLADLLRRRVRLILARPAVQRVRWLHDQLEQSAEGPCAHIGEGFSRYHPREFARFVRIAKASLSETITHLDTARAKELVGEAEHHELVRLAKRARGAATRLILYLEGATAPNVPRTAPPQRARRTRPRGDD